MSNKALGLALLVAGILILAASLLADVIGIGTQPGVFGWKQIAGVVVGLVIGAAGLAVTLRRTGEA